MGLRLAFMSIASPSVIRQASSIATQMIVSHTGPHHTAGRITLQAASHTWPHRTPGRITKRSASHAGRLFIDEAPQAIRHGPMWNTSPPRGHDVGDDAGEMPSLDRQELPGSEL